jgi:hypothetical protein
MIPVTGVKIKVAGFSSRHFLVPGFKGTSGTTIDIF